CSAPPSASGLKIISQVQVSAPASGCTSANIASSTPLNTTALPIGVSITFGCPKTFVACPPSDAISSNLHVACGTPCFEVFCELAAKHCVIAKQTTASCIALIVDSPAASPSTTHP